MTRRLIIIISANLLDVTTQTIQLQCAAVLSENEERGEPPDVMTDFFEGLLDKAIIKKKVDEMLHLILDAAQRACESTVQFLTGDSLPIPRQTSLEYRISNKG